MEFELQLPCRTLALPIPGIKQERIGASAVILSSIASQERPNYRGMEEVAKEEDTYFCASSANRLPVSIAVWALYYAMCRWAATLIRC